MTSFEFDQRRRVIPSSVEPQKEREDLAYTSFYKSDLVSCHWTLKMVLQTTLGLAIEELYSYLLLKCEEIASALKFLVPTVFHKLLADLWTAFKIFILDCLEILDIYFLTVAQHSQLHHRDLYDLVSPHVVSVTLKTRENAYALEAKRKSLLSFVGKYFNHWKNAVSSVEKEIIHPSVKGATETTKRYITRVAEPAISITQPVWHPIVEKVVEVNGAVVASPILGPLIDKVEHMMYEAVDSVVAYCNNVEEVPAQ